MDTLQKTKKLIGSLRRRKAFSSIDVFSQTKENEDWFYYFQINGFKNEKYFSLDISHSKIWGGEKINIVSTTECRAEIAGLLEEFKLLD